jgi:hypothetical protein
MSAPSATTRPAAAADGGVSQVISTGAVFAAVLERLNRDTSLALVEQLAQEIDAHCRTLIVAQVAEEFRARERTWRRRWLALMAVALVLLGSLVGLLLGFGLRGWGAAS